MKVLEHHDGQFRVLTNTDKKLGCLSTISFAWSRFDGRPLVFKVATFDAR